MYVTDHRDDLLDAVPNLRRYAFCIVGRQDEGDALVERVLHNILSDGVQLTGSSCSVCLFKAFNTDRSVNTACRNAAKRSPENAQVYYDLAYYSGRCGYPSSTTERMVRKAIRRDPGNPRYRIGLATPLVKENRLDDAYELVRELPTSQIVTLTCSCCLEKLVDLFRRASDNQRVIACRQRLVELRLRGCGFEC